MWRVEELISGEKHSGAVISLQALSESISIAVGLQVLGIILAMAGFDSEAAAQSQLAMTWVEKCLRGHSGSSNGMRSPDRKEVPDD